MPGRSQTIRARLRAALTRRPGPKLAALFFALVLWVMVSAEEPTQEWVDVDVALTMDSTVTLASHVPRVQALILGRGRELLKLYTIAPVIHRVVPRDAPADTAFDLRPGDVDLPAGISAQVSDVRPHAIEVRFRVVESRRVAVRSAVHAVPDSGVRIVWGPRFDPESVTVRGPRAAVRRLTSVATVPTTLVVRQSDTYTVPLDTAGLGVQVIPAHVEARVFADRVVTPPDSSAPARSGAAPPRHRGSAPRAAPPRHQPR